MPSTPVDGRLDAAVPVGPEHAGNAGHPVAHRWWALAVIGLAQVMVVLDATIVNIALPSAQRSLGFSNDDRQWVITAYSLAFGSLLLLGGRLADLFGRRTTFLIGLVGFAGASALGGAANGFAMLVAARALQGMFGALLAPSALSLLTTTFTDPKERSKAFGIFGAIAGSGGAVGLLLGGVLTEHLNWRWTLYVNDAIAVLAVIGALTFLHHLRPTERPKLDLPGTLLVGGGLFCLVYGFSNAQTDGWSDQKCWAFLVASGVLLVAFAIWETRSRSPLLPLRILADRNRAGSFVTVFISGTGMFGISLFLTYYLQGTLGYSPVKTGISFLPMVGALMVTAQISVNLLIPRLGPRPVVPVGMGVAAGGLVWLTRLDLTSSYTQHVLPPLLLVGVGLGLVMPPAMSLATLGVVARDQGVASATVNTMQQVGGSVGTSLFNTVATTSATDYVKDHPTMPHVLAHASVHSYSTAYYWAAAFFAGGLLMAAIVFRWGRPLMAGPAAEHGMAQQPADRGPVEAAPVPPSRPGEDTLQLRTKPAAARVQGRVLTADGSPVSYAAVTLIDAGGRQLGRATATLDGRYGVDAPGSGTYVLVGSASGHQPQVSTVTLDSVPIDLDLVLAGSGGIAGTVTAEGAAVPGALVVATDAYGEVAQSTTTDEQGRYQLVSLTPGPYTVTVSAEGRRPVAEPVMVTATAPTRYDAELASAATVRGTVRGRGGRPVPDARVALLDTAGKVIRQQVTGEDGVYTFADLAEGEYTVVTSGYPAVSASISVDGPGWEGFDFVLSHDAQESR